MGAVTPITLEEFEALPDDGFRHELNRGELITKPFRTIGNGRLIRRIFTTLNGFLRSNPLGELLWCNTAFLRSRPGEPVTLVGPDLAYMPQERAVQFDDSTKWAPGAAELTIEVVTSSDTPSKLLDKVAQYLGAGGLLVWVVYPEEREVRVFEASGAMRILGGGDSIEAPDLLPGFSARVAAFFES